MTSTQESSQAGGVVEDRDVDPAASRLVEEPSSTFVEDLKYSSAPECSNPGGRLSAASSPSLTLSRRSVVTAGAFVGFGMVLAIGVSVASWLTMPDPISNNNTSPMPSAPSVITPEQEIANPDAADIAASILPSVTSVLTSAAGMQGGGSGVVLSGDGLILTNNHVIAGAETIQVRFDDGTTTGASTVGVDNADDLAVIRAAGVTGLSPAHLTSPVRVGEPVLAFGSPFGLAGTVTEGIVSAVNRPVWTAAPKGPGQGEDAIVDTIQTDAAVNPGNSGGPLVDMSGNVVGINSAFATLPSTASAGVMPLGIGFAIPAEQADRIARQLIATGHATRADLGATVDENTNPLTAPATIAAVQAGGSAEKAGLEVGDTITAFGGRPLDTAAAVLAALHSAPPDSIIQMTYRRGPASNTISVTLGSVPARMRPGHSQPQLQLPRPEQGSLWPHTCPNDHNP